MIIIDVAKRFSHTPFGRFESDGEFSAEKFREQILKPELKKGDDVVIDFTHVALGVGSSFLEETFGGLVRQGYDKKELLQHLSVKDKMNFYNDQVKYFIEQA
ncbi:STAS-like domain-containing protein [Photobacterium leiognathi subsp. mandapamensis]|uniref:STAS-like domain-containing protein n=1 Tax=Photobacterium leiognathi TaxID=553611 RepID=UPI0029826FC1|nr:STAS-like domain-containing protein [Photobacterium leiognathi]